METTIDALIGGAITGAVIGLGQWLALRSRLLLRRRWVALSAVGMGVGLTASVALFGTQTSDITLVWRACSPGCASG